MTDHPTQPIEMDDRGVVRFKANTIVKYLLERGSLTLNDIYPMLMMGKFPVEDYMQLMQLIGYSTSGYGDLAYGDQDWPQWKVSADQADAACQELMANQARPTGANE